MSTLAGTPFTSSDAQRVLESAKDPVWFFKEVLGWRPSEVAQKLGLSTALTTDQRRICRAIQTHRRTAVASGVGTGKTFVAAAIAHWFLFTNPRSIVVTTGPGAKQVEHQLWRDIRTIYARSQVPLGGRILNTRLDLADDWFMIGLAPAVGQQEETAVRMHGYHAPKMLVIVDEAGGVDHSILRAAEDITLGPDDRILALFNPTNPTCAMKREWDSGRWHTIIVSGRNHPNVVHDNPLIIPGAITRQWIADHESDPLASAVIDGIWTDTGEHGLIPEKWVRLAEARWLSMAEAGAWGPVHALGVDVGAGVGADATTIASRCGWAIRDIFANNDEGPMGTEGRIIAACRSNGAYGPCPLPVVDAIGVGAGVVDALRQDGWPVLPFVANATAIYPGSDNMPIRDKTGVWGFADSRAAAWWTMRELLDPSNDLPVALPPDDELRAELSALHFFPISGGRYRVESKLDVRKRLGRSTDKADAVIQAFWSTLQVQEEIAPWDQVMPTSLNEWEALLPSGGRLGGW